MTKDRGRIQVSHLHGGHINRGSSQDTHSLQHFASLGWFLSHKCAHVQAFFFPNALGTFAGLICINPHFPCLFISHRKSMEENSVPREISSGI